MNKYRFFAILSIIVCTLPIWAENGMNSPYTRYGFGQLSSMSVGANKGIGGTGIGLQNSSQINLLNPASYAAVDTLTFLMDIGMSLHNTNFEAFRLLYRVSSLPLRDRVFLQPLLKACVFHR